MWQYMQDLDNRDLYQETFLDEMKVRTMGEPHQSSVVPGPLGPVLDATGHTVTIRRKIAKILSDVCVKHAPPSETLATFWSRRMEWCASGSAPGAKHWIAGTTRRDATAATKLSLAAMLPSDFLEWTMQQQPVTLSKAVHKFENGKNRNLWNCLNGLYYLEAYLSCGFEKGLTGVAGMRITDGGAQSIIGAVDRNMAVSSDCWVLSYDFHDFNYYHLLRHQAYLVDMIGKVRSTGGVVPNSDYARVGAYLAQCRLNTVLVDPTSDTVGVADTALVTGLRLTTVTNTIFNAVYLETATDLLRQWDIPVETVINDRLGDDVFSVGHNWAPLAALSDMVNAIGYTGQGIKIELDQRGEFLRLEYEERGIFGYLNRTLPNLASGEWDLSPGSGVSERASALWEQLQKIARRGGTLDPLAWWRSLVRPLCGSKVFGRVGAPPKSWLFSHASRGGANIATLVGEHYVWAQYDFSRAASIPLAIPAALSRTLVGPGIRSATDRVAKLGIQLKHAEREVVEGSLVRTAFAKCWPSQVTRSWHAYMASLWIDVHGVRTTVPSCELVELPDQLWFRAATNLRAGVEAEHTTIRGCWARLDPPLLLAVKIAIKQHGGQLKGFHHLLVLQELNDLVDIIDRWRAHYSDEDIMRWVFDEYQWPSVSNESLGEYGAALVRVMCDQILSILSDTIDMDNNVLQTIWLSVWHKVYTLGTFVY
jgi:hypothetical protein